MQNPAMPGMKIDLLKMTAKGSGDRTFDLTKILPSKGTVDFHSDSSMAMDMGGQKQGMTMKMDMNIRLEGK